MTATRMCRWPAILSGLCLAVGVNVGEASAPGVRKLGDPKPTIPPVRVLLENGPVATTRVAVRGPYQWRLAGSDIVVAEGERLAPVVIKATAKGVAQGERELLAGRLELVPKEDGSLLVGDRAYRGFLRILKPGPDKLLVINVVGVEPYVASVTSGEMPRSFPTAALRAQAIAARTYVLYQMKTADADAPFDVYASVRDQHYPGRNWETTGSLDAVTFTHGIVLTCQGRLFCAYYSACCGGRTADVSDVPTFSQNAAPLLTSVACPWCRLPDNNRYAWEATFDGPEITRLLKAYFKTQGVTIGEVTGLTVAQRFADGRAAQVLVEHTGGSARMSAEAFRRNGGGYAKVRSTRFDIRRDGDRFVVSGTGWGHGVGMCQWGARGLAEAGRNCVEILKYYYPGCGLVMVY